MEETTQTTANDSSVDEILLGSTDVNDQTMDISNDSEPISVQSDERVTGQVKWFNDTQGYGFIKPTDDSGDIFVHISDLQPMQNSFKPCLYTGEYVSFALASNGENDNGSMRLKAIDVRGVFGGSLICDHGTIEFKSYSRVGFDSTPFQSS